MVRGDTPYPAAELVRALLRSLLSFLLNGSLSSSGLLLDSGMLPMMAFLVPL
ncbi:hypothetical protein BDW66DRAFT_138917 [Aspergillus desertorum]